MVADQLEDRAALAAGLLLLVVELYDAPVNALYRELSLPPLITSPDASATYAPAPGGLAP